MTPRHAGENWTSEQDEVVRLACLGLADQLGRTWAAVKARIERLSDTNWHVKWPANRPAPTSFQVMQDLPSAYLYLSQQLVVGRAVSLSAAALEFQHLGFPRPHAVLILEQLHKKGWVQIEPTSRTQRTVTVLPDGPTEPGWRWR